jgi:DNA-binding NtrC family response regulator
MQVLPMIEKLDVLLVDDEKIVGNRLKPVLSKIGCAVEVFEDSTQALNRIREKEFDIIVTDIMMEGVTGIEILQEAREASERTKVIIITGYANVSLAREAMDKGAFDIIEKPFRPDDLRSVVTAAAAALGFKELIPKAP